MIKPEIIFLKMRITYSGSEFDQEIVDFLCNQRSTGVWMYCNEISKEGKYHSHLYLDTTFTRATIARDMRGRGYKGNETFCTKLCDECCPIEYLGYMMKDGDYHHHGISEEILKEAFEYNEKVKTDLAKKGKKKFTVLEECWLDLFEDNTRAHEFPLSKLWSMIAEWYLLKGKMLEPERIRKMAITYACRLDKHGTYITQLGYEYTRNLPDIG